MSGAIDLINSKIPSDTTTSNKLVNSSQMNTAISGLKFVRYDAA